MTQQDFATLVRLYTRTDSTTFTDADILAYMNAYRDTLAIRFVADVDEDYFLMPFTRDLVAGTREYGFPDEVLGKIKSVQANVGGTKWAELREFDLAQYRRPTDEDSILRNFAGADPAYDIMRRALVIYSGTPIVDVPDGLKLYAACEIAKFTSLAGSTDLSVDPTATSFGLPRGLHELLARHVSICWKSYQDPPVPLSEPEKSFGDDLTAALKQLRGTNQDRGFVPSSPVDDGQDY